MNNAIEKLTNMNAEIRKLQKIYCEKKTELKQLESELYLYGEEEVKKAIGKDKPSQKDKEHYCQLKTLKLSSDVDKAYLDYKYAQEEFKIMKMAFKAEHPNNETSL